MTTHHLPLLLAAGFFGLHSISNAQSFVDWVGVTNGSLTGSGPWAGYGTASYSITFFGNSDGESGGLFTPARAQRNNPASLDPFGMGAANGTYRWLDIYAGKIDETQNNANVGYSITFGFSDALGGDTFPATDPVFYLSDVDGGNFLVSATNNGMTVDTSNWFYATI